jgi:hypothetical protein
MPVRVLKILATSSQSAKAGIFDGALTLAD